MNAALRPQSNNGLTPAARISAEQEMLRIRQEKGSGFTGGVVSIIQANEHRQTMNGLTATKRTADGEKVYVLEPHHGRQPQSLHGRSTPIAKILVPIDFSPESKQALKYAAIFMRQFGSSLTLLHILRPTVLHADYGYGLVLRQIVDDSEVKKAQIGLDNMRKKWLGVGVPAVSMVRIGTPDTEIVRSAKELRIGLIVMASHSSVTSMSACTGIAQKVVGLAGCPVLVVHTNDEPLSKRYRPNPKVKDSLTLN